MLQIFLQGALFLHRILISSSKHFDKMVNQAAINLVKNAVNIVKSVQDSQVQIQNDRAQGKPPGISYNNHRFEKPTHLQSLF